MGPYGLSGRVTIGIFVLYCIETNKLPIGKGIGECLRKTSQDEGHHRPDKVTHDEPTRVAINYVK